MKPGKNPLKATFAGHMKQPKNSDALSGFFKCPRGHNLPHRVKGKGRCAPFDCCLAKDGAHGVVRAEDAKDKAESLAYAEATMELADMKNAMQAWNDAHPLPELPPPLKTSSVREYIEKRLEQVMPLSLERRIRKAVLDPGHQGEVAARELLNRGGYGERPEIRQTFHGPVLIVQSAEQMKVNSPYAQQGKEHETAKLVDGVANVVLGGVRNTEGSPARVVEEAGEDDEP